jgi:hypothetical protein
MSRIDATKRQTIVLLLTYVLQLCTDTGKSTITSIVQRQGIIILDISLHLPQTFYIQRIHFLRNDSNHSQILFEWNIQGGGRLALLFFSICKLETPFV